MYILKAFQDVLITPKQFFQSKRDDNRLGGTFFYGFLLTVVSGLMRYGYIVLTHGINELDRNPKVTNVATMLHIDTMHLIIIAVILYAVLMFLGLLFIPLFIHVGMKIMKGTGSLRKTYQAFIFGSTPYFILGAFPILGYAALVYGLYIKVIGLSEFHHIRFDYTIVGYIIGRVIGAIASFIALFIVFLTIAAIVGFYLFGNDVGGFKEFFDFKSYTATSTKNIHDDCRGADLSHGDECGNTYQGSASSTINIRARTI